MTPASLIFKKVYFKKEKKEEKIDSDTLPLVRSYLV
jgi:hypothetical protein